jgi:hypothetical protein
MFDLRRRVTKTRSWHTWLPGEALPKSLDDRLLSVSPRVLRVGAISAAVALAGGAYATTVLHKKLVGPTMEPVNLRPEAMLPAEPAPPIPSPAVEAPQSAEPAPLIPSPTVTRPQVATRTRTLAPERPQSQRSIPMKQGTASNKQVAQVSPGNSPGPGKATSSRGLPRAIVYNRVHDELPRVIDCYETKALSVDPQLAGIVQTEFEIQPDGTPTSVVASGLTTEVASCVGRVVSSIRFPHTGGDSVHVIYPFNLNKEEAPGASK